jgi:hypothetical protein
VTSIRLLDGSFRHQFSATLGGDNANRFPSYFEWSPFSIEKASGEYTFYTDMRIKEARSMPGKKVAWLLEPPSLSRTHYDNVLEMMGEFDCVLSFWKPYLKAFGDRGLFYPLGGSWVEQSKQGIHRKTKDVCIIVSQKKGAVGHRMRHSAVELFADRLHIDVFGRGYKPFDSKAEILKPYRYAIVIESWVGEDYFSEKLIDAISMGCVPIYNGCPNIKDYFNKSGILTFDTLKAMENILINVTSKHDYNMRMDAIVNNFELCKQYQCAEDWIYENYGYLFT